MKILLVIAALLLGIYIGMVLAYRAVLWQVDRDIVPCEELSYMGEYPIERCR